MTSNTAILATLLVLLFFCQTEKINIGILTPTNSEYPDAIKQLEVNYTLFHLYFMTSKSAINECMRYNYSLIIDIKPPNEASKQYWKITIPFILAHSIYRHYQVYDHVIDLGIEPDIMAKTICTIIYRLPQFRIIIIYDMEHKNLGIEIIRCVTEVFQMEFFFVQNSSVIKVVEYINNKSHTQIISILSSHLSYSIFEKALEMNVLKSKVYWISVMYEIDHEKLRHFLMPNFYLMVLLPRAINTRSLRSETSFLNSIEIVQFVISKLTIINKRQTIQNLNCSVSKYIFKEYLENLKNQIYNSSIEIWSSGEFQNLVSLTLVKRLDQFNPISIPSNAFHFNLTQFSNESISICYVNATPFIFQNGQFKNGSTENLQGQFIDMIIYLSKKLNFRINLYPSPDNQFGALRANGTFTGCIGELQLKRANIGGAWFYFNEDRLKTVDFISLHAEFPLKIIFLTPKQSLNIYNVYRPIEFKVWILLLLTFLIVSFACFVNSKFNPFSAWNLKLKFAILDEVKFLENIWQSIGAFLLQGQDFYGYSISSRFVLAIWWIFSVIFIAVYSANMTSFLTVSNKKSEILTLEDFANQNSVRLYLTIGEAPTVTIQKSQDRNIQIMHNKSVSISERCISFIQKTSLEDVGCVSDHYSILYLYSLNCSRYTILNEVVDTGNIGFAVQKNSLLKEAIQKEVSNLAERGIINKWFYQSINTSTPCDDIDNINNNDPIGLDTLVGVYVLVIGLYVLGLVLVACERMTWRKIRKSSINF